MAKSKQLRRLDRVLIESIGLPKWREVFERIEYPPGLGKEELSYDAVTDALGGSELNNQHLELIECLHSLGNENGREELDKISEAFRLDTSGWPQGLGAAEWALHIFLYQLSDNRAHNVLVQVQHTIQQKKATRTERHFTSTKPVPSGLLARFEERLSGFELRVAHRAGQLDLGDKVWIYFTVEERTVELTIVRGKRTWKGPGIDDEQKRRQMVSFRPVDCDLIRYDSEKNWLTMMTNDRRLIEEYPRIMGQVFFDAGDYFDDPETLNLDLIRNGQPSLEVPHSTHVIEAKLAELAMEDDDAEYHIKANDCFSKLENRGFRIGEVKAICWARIKLTVRVNQSLRRPSIKISHPNRVQYSLEYQPFVEPYLRATGLLGRPAVHEVDLWNAPRTRSIEEWREMGIGSVDALVHEGVFEQAWMDRAPDPDNRQRSLLVDQNPRTGEHWSVSDDEAAPVIPLGLTEREGLVLKPDKLGAYLSKHLNFAAEAREVQSPGIISLGGAVLARGVFAHLFLVAKDPKDRGVSTDAIVMELRQVAAEEGYFVLLVPKGRSANLGIPQLHFTSWEPIIGLRQQIIKRLDLQREVPAVDQAPEGTEFIVDAGTGEVWWTLPSKRRAKLEFSPGSLRFKLLIRLAEEAPNLVSNDELDSSLFRVCKNRPSEERRRDCAGDLRKQFRKDLKAQGLPTDPVKNLIRTVTGEGMSIRMKAFVKPG